MAKARGRGTSTDQDRYPNFEGVGADFADSNYPGANRGQVSTGAPIAQPKVRGPQRRIEGLRASKGQQAREAARAEGASPRVAAALRATAPAVTVGATGRPTQGGTGALETGPGGRPRQTGKRKSRRG